MIIKNLIPKEFCQYFTHVLLRNIDLQEGSEYNKTGVDPQAPKCRSYMDHHIIFETLQERLWDRVEGHVGRPLIPTYAYARLYENGEVLETHVDRPACEVSVTLQLGRSHHYSYPIYLEGQRVDLAEGDGLLYLGKEQKHWRDKCDGPDGYYSGQVFLHYVYADGEHADEGGDKNFRDLYSYRKNRTELMEIK